MGCYQGGIVAGDFHVWAAAGPFPQDIDGHGNRDICGSINNHSAFVVMHDPLGTGDTAPEGKDSEESQHG